MKSRRLIQIILFVYLSIGVFIWGCFNYEWVPPTPPPGYRGSCTFWASVPNNKKGETCVWGIVLDGETSMSGIWIHFSSRRNPFPDFAAKINSVGNDNWNFKTTGANVTKYYAGHCIEIHGYLKYEYNHYDGEGVDQPIIELYTPDQVLFCD